MEKKYKKISQAWWRTHVIPATCEVEAGEPLNPGSRGCSESRSCHCDKNKTLSQKSLFRLKQVRSSSGFLRTPCSVTEQGLINSLHVTRLCDLP